MVYKQNVNNGRPAAGGGAQGRAPFAALPMSGAMGCITVRDGIIIDSQEMESYESWGPKPRKILG